MMVLRVSRSLLLPMLVAYAGFGICFVNLAVAEDDADTSHDDAAVVKASGRFADIFEPSGVAELPDGQVLVIEDEQQRPLWQMRVVSADTDPVLKDEVPLPIGANVFDRLNIGKLDDLEAVARDASGRLLVAGSHDDAMTHRASDRQKLLVFSLQDAGMTNLSLRRKLARDLRAAYPALLTGAGDDDDTSDQALNIEAMAIDRRRGTLLIGLRTPLAGKKAVVVRVSGIFDRERDESAPFHLAESVWTLDLDRGGLRALAYDDQSDELLMISRREGKGHYRLWRMPADGSRSPQQVTVAGQKSLFDKVEGVTALSRTPMLSNRVLFVRDDGKRSAGRGASWFMLSRKQIGLIR